MPTNLGYWLHYPRIEAARWQWSCLDDGRSLSIYLIAWQRTNIGWLLVHLQPLTLPLILVMALVMAGSDPEAFSSF